MCITVQLICSDNPATAVDIENISSVWGVEYRSQVMMSRLFVISEPSAIGFVFSLVMFLILIITIGFTKVPQEIKQKLSLFSSVTVVMDRESMRSDYFGTVFLSDGSVLHRQDGGHPRVI